MRWLQEEKQGRPLSVLFLCFTWPGNDHFTHSCTDPSVYLIKRKQSSASILGNTDGTEGKARGDLFPWFQALSFSVLFPPTSTVNFSSFKVQAQPCLLPNIPWNGRIFHTLASPSLRDMAEKGLVCSFQHRLCHVIHLSFC